jgi:hypothetical protein
VWSGAVRGVAGLRVVGREEELCIRSSWVLGVVASRNYLVTAEWVEIGIGIALGLGVGFVERVLVLRVVSQIVFGIEVGPEVAIFVLVLLVVGVVFGIEFDMGSGIEIAVFLLLVEIALQLV